MNAQNNSQFDFFERSHPFYNFSFEQFVHLNDDIQSVFDQFHIILGNDSPGLDYEQKQEMLNKMINTIDETIIPLQRFNQTQLRQNINLSYPILPSDNTIFSLTIDYIKSTSKIYNQNIFYTEKFPIYVVSLNNFISIFIDLILNSKTQFTIKDFRESWNENYNVSLTYQNFLKSLDFPKLYMDFFSSLGLNNTESQTLNNSIEKLNSDINRFKTEEISDSLIQTTISDLEDLEICYFGRKQNEKTKKKEKNLSSLYYSLLANLECFSSMLNILNLGKKLNQLIINNDIILPKIDPSLQNEKHSWMFLSILIDSISLNFKIQQLLKPTPDLFETKIMQIISHLTNLTKFFENIANKNKISKQEIDQFEYYHQVLDEIQKSSHYNYTEMINQFFPLYKEKFLNLSLTDNSQNRIILSNLSKCINEFQNLCIIPQNDLFLAKKKLQIYIKIEDLIQELCKISGFSPFDFVIHTKMLLFMNFSNLSTMILIQNLKDLILKIERYPRSYFQKFTQNRVSLDFYELFLIINEIKIQKANTKNAEIFVNFLLLFFKFSNFVITTNNEFHDDRYRVVIDYLMKSFPDPKLIKQIFPIEEIKNDIIDSFSKMQSSYIELAHSHSFDINSNNINQSEEIIHLFAEYLRNDYPTIMSNIISKLYSLKFIALFMKKYNFLLTKYYQSQPRTLRSTPDIKASIVVNFPKFLNLFIFILSNEENKKNISCSLLKNIYAVIRYVILSDDADNNLTFQNIINELPFINYSKLLGKAFKSTYFIDVIIFDYILNQPSKNFQNRKNQYLNTSNQLKKFLLKIIVTYDFTILDFNNIFQKFLSIIVNISSSLYATIEHYINDIVHFVHYLHKLIRFIKIGKTIIADFHLNNDKLYSFKDYAFINYVCYIQEILYKLSNSPYLSKNLTSSILELNECMKQLQINHLFYCDAFDQTQSIFSQFIIELQKIRRILHDIDFSMLIKIVQTYFGNLIKEILKNSKSSFQIIDDEMKQVLSLLNYLSQNNKENEISILIRLKFQLKQIYLLNSGNLPSYIDFSQNLKLIFYIVFSKCYLSILDSFIAQYISEKDFKFNFPMLNYTSRIIDSETLFFNIPHILSRFDKLSISLQDHQNLPQVVKSINVFIHEINILKESTKSSFHSIIKGNNQIMHEIQNAKNSAEKYLSFIEQYKLNLRNMQEKKSQLSNKITPQNEYIESKIGILDQLISENSQRKSDLQKLVDKNQLRQNFLQYLRKKSNKLDNQRYSMIPEKKKNSKDLTIDYFSSKALTFTSPEINEAVQIDISEKYNKAFLENKMLIKKLKSLIANIPSNLVVNKYSQDNTYNKSQIDKLKLLLDSINNLKNEIFSMLEYVQQIERNYFKAEANISFDRNNLIRQYISSSNSLIRHILNLIQTYNTFKMVQKKISKNKSNTR